MQNACHAAKVENVRDRFVMSEIPRAVGAEPLNPTAASGHLLPTSAIPAGVPIDSAGVPSGESCPPPLAWQEVLNAYRADSRPWELDRGSRRLSGRTWGNGPPIYLLNGFVATAEMYALLIWLLRDSFKCVVFDTKLQPGARRTQLSVSDFADDVFAVADYHSDPTIHVFGPSFGAAVALQAALDQPERIANLVLQHGFARRPLSWSERLLARWYRNSRRTLATLPWRRRIQELNHRRWFPPFDGTRFEFMVETTGQIPVAALARKAMAMHAFNVEGRLSQLNCPVLLVRTEGQGNLETAGHEALERQLPSARTEWLHSSGLHPYLTHPHRLAKLLKAACPAAPS